MRRPYRDRWRRGDRDRRRQSARGQVPEQSGRFLRTDARAAADRRRLRPPLFPRPAARRRRRSCSPCIRGRFDFETLPFVNVARCSSGCRFRFPRSSGTTTRSASSRRRISATSRCRRISARDRSPITRRSIARRSALIAQLQRRGADARLGRLPALSRRVRCREADVGAGVSSRGIISRAIAACR